jgi:hypothetical protein
MDAIVSIKRNHHTATPQKRAAMETLWAPRYFKMKTTGWIRFQPLAKLRDAKDKALQGQ